MKLKITVDNKVYEVEVEASEPEQRHPSYLPAAGHARVAAASPPAMAVPKPAAGGEPVADESKVCRSPFAGMVAKVAAQVGQTIQVNDTLLVLEAMKMETVITAPFAGKIAKLNVKPGDTVTGGQVLVEFE